MSNKSILVFGTMSVCRQFGSKLCYPYEISRRFKSHCVYSYATVYIRLKFFFSQKSQVFSPDCRKFRQVCDVGFASPDAYLLLRSRIS